MKNRTAKEMINEIYDYPPDFNYMTHYNNKSINPQHKNALIITKFAHTYKLGSSGSNGVHVHFTNDTSSYIYRHIKNNNGDIVEVIYHHHNLYKIAIGTIANKPFIITPFFTYDGNIPQINLSMLPEHCYDIIFHVPYKTKITQEILEKQIEIMYNIFCDSS